MCSHPGYLFSLCITLLSWTIDSFNLRSCTNVWTETRSVCVMRSPPRLIPSAWQRPSDWYPSAYIVLILMSVRCVLAIYPSDVHRHSRASYIKGLFLLQHDSQRCRLSSQLSDRSLSTVCWNYLGDNHRQSRPLHIKTPLLAQYDSRHAVCPRYTRTLGSLSTTLAIVVHLRNHQTGVCPLHIEVPSWLQPLMSLSVASQESSLHLARLSVLLYVFIALRPKSIRCVLGLIFFLTWPSV